MAYKYTIPRNYILNTAKRLSSQGIKVHKGLRNINVRELKYQFSYLVNLAKEDWKNETGEDILPDRQYELLRKSFAEEIVKAENLKPRSTEDWTNIFLKTAKYYDANTSYITNVQIIQKSVINIENSNIYFDIINSIASKAARLQNDQSRFKQIKYDFVEEGTGDLDETRFRDLLSDGDLFALSKLSKVYKFSNGFTLDPLYQEIKQRAVNKGLNLVGNLTINTVQSAPSGPTFDFDF